MTARMFMRRDLISPLCCTTSQSQNQDLGMSQGNKDPPRGSLTSNPSTASHDEIAVVPQPLWPRKCPQRSGLGRPLPLTPYVSDTHQLLCVANSYWLCCCWLTPRWTGAWQ